MRAIVCSEYGPSDTLRMRDIAVPALAAGEVRLRIEAAGVNFPDTLIIENKYQIKPELPFSPGAEVAGVVEAVGDGVDGVAVGTPVIAMIGYGGFAEYVCAPASKILRRPTTMPATVAAGFSMGYGTSMHALKQRGCLKAGESLLVLGASGGVGLAAVEIGKAMGARVIAAASTPAKLEAAIGAGADEAINYTEVSVKERIKELTEGRGVDVVFDPVGGDFFEEALRSTAWGGRVLVVGFASGIIPKPPLNLPLLKGCSIVGVFYGSFRDRDPQANEENFEQLFHWYEEGKIRPLISEALPLEEAAIALQMISSREAIGKIVLTV